MKNQNALFECTNCGENLGAMGQSHLENLPDGGQTWTCGLSMREYEELKGLHDVISHVECFNSRDLLRENQLMQKATDDQLLEICTAHYQEEL